MKNVAKLFLFCFTFSCSDGVENTVSSKSVESFTVPASYDRKIKKLRLNKNIVLLEGKLKRDKDFSSHTEAIKEMTRELYKYKNNNFKPPSLAGLKNIDEIIKKYENAGMIDADKRVKSKTRLLVTWLNLCKKYPEFCRLSNEDQKTIIFANADLTVNKEFKIGNLSSKNNNNKNK